MMQRLKELREKKNMTQTQVGDLIGVSCVTIGRYESGEREPSNDKIIALAKYFGVSVDYLLGNDKQEGEPEWEPAEDKSSANRRALHEIIDKFSDEDIPDVINHLKALEIVCQHKKETK